MIHSEKQKFYNSQMGSVNERSVRLRLYGNRTKNQFERLLWHRLRKSVQFQLNRQEDKIDDF